MVSAGRTGHSLPELIVAVTVLAATVPAVGGMAVLAARVAGDAVARQEALRLGAEVLDSVADAGFTTPGSRSRAGIVADWSADPAPGAFRVTVVGTAGRTLLTLRGRPSPRIPVLPDDVAAASSAGTGGTP